MFRRTTLLTLLALLLPAVGVAKPRSSGSPGFVQWPIFCPPGTVGVLLPGASQGPFAPLRSHEVVSLTDTLVRALEDGGVRLPAVRTYARVTRSGHIGTCYVRPFDVDPDVSHWVLYAGLAPVPVGDVAARGRFADLVQLREPCAAEALSMTLLPGLGAIEVSRRVGVGRTLVCEDRDEAGAYGVTEQPGPDADGDGHCEWTFDLPGGPLPASKGGDPRHPGGPPVPLTELLASGRPVFEAFASIQQTVCGDPASP